MKKYLPLIPLAALFTAVFVSSCKKEERNDNIPPMHLIYGCTDKAALNYTDTANYDNGTCAYWADLYNGNYKAYDSVFSANSLYPPAPPSADTFVFNLLRMRSDTVCLRHYICDYDSVF
jgi:hypothetical protein